MCGFITRHWWGICGEVVTSPATVWTVRLLPRCRLFCSVLSLLPLSSPLACHVTVTPDLPFSHGILEGQNRRDRPVSFDLSFPSEPCLLPVHWPWQSLALPIRSYFPPTGVPFPYLQNTGKYTWFQEIMSSHREHDDQVIPCLLGEQCTLPSLVWQGTFFWTSVWATKLDPATLRKESWSHTVRR